MAACGVGSNKVWRCERVHHALSCAVTSPKPQMNPPRYGLTELCDECFRLIVDTERLKSSANLIAQYQELPAYHR